MSFVCIIGANDHGPGGTAALMSLQVTPATWDQYGTATILLKSEGALYNVTAKLPVYVYETDTDGNITFRWFGGFVARVKTTIVKGTATRIYIVQCQDFNVQLDRLVGRAATAHAIRVPADTFEAQVAFVVDALQTGSGSGIDALSGVAALTGLTALRAQTFRGMSLRQMLQALCDEAQRADGALRPRFYLDYDPAAIWTTFNAPILQVYDFAVAGAVASWEFSDAPSVGQERIYGDFVRDVDATRLVNYQQTLQRHSEYIATGSDATSQGDYPNDYSGQNAWAALPVVDRYSQDSAVADAYATSLVANTAYPLEVVEFDTDARVRPGQYADVTMADEGIVAKRYQVLAVAWSFENENLDLFAHLVLGEYIPGQGQNATAEVANLRAAPKISIRHYGALADGATDDSAAVMAAIADAGWAGGGLVDLGPGTIRCDAQLAFADGVHLRGAGPGATTLDFSAVSGLATADPCISAAGTLGSPVGVLAADVALHDSQLIFTTDVGLAAGDVLLLYDSADYSFSGARKYYRGGEYLRVLSYDAASKTAHLTGRTHAAYARNVHGKVLITGAPTGGTYTLSYNGQTSGAIAYNATAATIQAALEALSSVGAGKVVCSSLGGQPDSPIDVVFDLSLTATSFSGTSALMGGTTPTLNVQAGRVAVYKPAMVRASIQGATLKYKYGQRGIKVEYGHGCSFRELHMSGSEYSLLELSHSFECDVVSVVGTDTNSSAGSYRYGLSIVNSQRVHVLGSTFETSRHGLVTGGSDLAGAIPVRELVVAGCTISGNKSAEDDNGINGCNLHGNSEHVVFSGCNLPNGIDVAGDHITITGCNIRNGAGNGVYMTETLGFNHSFIGNQIFITHDHPDNFGFVYAQFKAQYTARTGGTFRFADNYVDYGGYKNSTAGQALAGLYLYNVSGPSDNQVVIENNTFYSSLTSYTGPTLGPWVRAFSGAGIREVVLRNNQCRGVGMRVEETGSRTVIIEGNHVDTALDRGIFLKKPSGTPAYGAQVVICRDNTVRQSYFNGIQLEGSAQADTIIYVSGNLSINNNQSAATGTIALETSVYMHNAERVFFDNNVCGDNQGSSTQAAFWCADHITNLYDVNTRNIGGVTMVGLTNITNRYSGLATFTGSIDDSQHGNRGGGALHSAATTSANGFMSAADKTKIGQFSPTAGKTLTVSNTLTLAGTDSKALTLTGSLTVGADATISGGGTLALGGFTLTVPATGSAALLAVAQTFTAQQTFDVTSGSLRISAAASVVRDVQFHTNLSPRWILRTTNTTESGSNAGSNFQLLSRTDAGAALLTVLDVTRSTGKATFGGEIAATNLAITTAKVLTVAKSLTLDAASDGFTLTVPATGTAALLGTAQTFTATQTFNALIQGNNSLRLTGTGASYVAGNWGIGTSTLDPWDSSYRLMNFNGNNAVAGTNGSFFMYQNAYFDGTANKYGHSGSASRFIHLDAGGDPLVVFDGAASGSANAAITWSRWIEMSLAGGALKIGFLGASAAAQQTGGAATAAGSYGATEQTMLNKVYSAMRTFGFLN